MLINSLMVILILINMMLLGTGRLGGCIRIVAFQGILLGFLPLITYENILSMHIFFIAAGSLCVKGIVFPRLLTRALREAESRHEMEPFIGYSLSLILGVIALGFSFWIRTQLPPLDSQNSPLVLPVSFFTIITGLLLIIGRSKALTQVLGYLVMENGIYVFGVALAKDQPLLVELGVLLDVFMAVFVMGVTLFHINREFDHIDTDRLTDLKDWTS